jgi:5-keto-L-gluconate epimerase
MHSKKIFKGDIKQNSVSQFRKIKFAIAIGNSLPSNAPFPLGDELEVNLAKAKKYGYHAIELHNIREPKKVKVVNLLNLCNKYNLKISAISTGLTNYIDKLSLIDDSPKIREKTVIRINEYIDLASILKSFVMIGTIRGNLPDKLSYHKYETILVSSIKKISKYANYKKVTLLIEAANRYETNYLNNTQEIINFINKYNIEMLKIHLDTFHMNIEEPDISKSIIKTGDLLGYFHVSDSNRMFPGAGHIDFKTVIDALLKINYQGYIGVECFPIPDSDIASKKAIQNIKTIFEK